LTKPSGLDIRLFIFREVSNDSSAISFKKSNGDISFSKEGDLSMPEEKKTQVTIPVETVAQAYLEILRDRGVKYFFGNSGTDFSPIIDALAKFIAEKIDSPKPITYDLPVLVIVLNDGSYGASRRAVLDVFPDGWARRTNEFPFCGFTPSPRYEVVVTACGG
jgi:hypothetical protein